MHADKRHRALTVQHGLPTAGLCVAGATPAVDNPNTDAPSRLENQALNRPRKRGNFKA